MAQTVSELNTRHADAAERLQLLRLYGLRNFMSDSILPGRYRIPAALHEPIALTPYGEELSKRLMRTFKWPEARLACFLQFFHSELFVDHHKTDTFAVAAALNDEISAGKVLHPFIWGRELYDRAFEIFQSEPVEVSEAETARLLQGTPRGVFQEADLLTGPLGILQSEDSRLIPPIVTVPLFHCSRRSCMIVHRTPLRTTDSQIHKAQARLQDILMREYGKASEYGRFLSETANDHTGYFDAARSPADISLLGECFSREELDAIAHVALSGKSSPLRTALSKNLIEVRSPSEFLAGLDKAGLIQALLLMANSDLHACMDAAIHQGKISIPASEIRRPYILPIHDGYYNSTSECSARGVRTVPDDPAMAVLRLRRLILDIYDLRSEASRKSLSWLLRRVEGVSLQGRLDSYLSDELPVNIVRNLILAGPESFSIAAKACEISAYIDEGTLSDEELCQTILWKLGFDLRSGDPRAVLLRQQREQFAQFLTSAATHSDADRARIRSFSSNLFVGLEQMLDASLSFSVWSLTYDHWSSNQRFVYFLAEAREHMAQVLNEAGTGGESVSYDPAGHNTLFPLISGFSRLRDCLQAAQGNPDQHLRAESEYPRFAKAANLTRFPFPYTLPFLNLAEDSQERILENLGEMTKVLTSGAVASVRNRLEHQREDFPSVDEIIRCIRAINEFAQMAEETGFYPMVCHSAGYSVDSAGRSSRSFEDYRGREIMMRSPTGISGSGMPGLAQEQIIVPIARIAESTSPLRFSIGSKSSYAERWKDWPRIRPQSGVVLKIDEAGQRRNSEAG